MSYRNELMMENVGVGTKGTIGSLMSRELEYIRRMEQFIHRPTSDAPKSRTRRDTVSVFCEILPLASLSRKTTPKIYQHAITPRSSNSNVDTMEVRKGIGRTMCFEPSSCRWKVNSYIARVDDQMLIRLDGKGGELGGHVSKARKSVEVVDLKCNCKRNNSQTGLRRFSFSRLSDASL